MSDTTTRVLKVLEKIKEDIIDNDELVADMYSEALEDMLNMLHFEDAFGTEGQDDPRGDFRNGEWSMNRVEGIDK